MEKKRGERRHPCPYNSGESCLSGGEICGCIKYGMEEWEDPSSCRNHPGYLGGGRHTAPIEKIATIRNFVSGKQR